MERVGCFFLAILAFQHGNLDGKYRGDKLKWKLFDSQSAPNHNIHNNISKRSRVQLKQ